MQFLTRITLRMLLAVASIALLTPSYANAEDFYAGKTITVIVGVSAGSGGDVSARTFMAGLTEKIPVTQNYSPKHGGCRRCCSAKLHL